MPVTYSVSNVGQNYETPPRYQRQEPYQDQGYYGSVKNSPYQNQGFNGSIRSPYHDQGYYKPGNKGPNYQDQGYYMPGNKGPNYQDQGYYGSVNRNPYQNQGYYGGPISRNPNYYQDQGYESEMSDNYQDYGYGSYVDPYRNRYHGGYAINNPPQPQPLSQPQPQHFMPSLREQSQISDTIEWKETPTAHVYKAYLEGSKRNEVEVEVEVNEDVGRVLHVKCYKGVDYRGQHVQEIQSITLPDDANTEQVKANMENGVLTVTVPKLARNMFINSFGVSYKAE